jgi:subtilisin family serine protease
MTVFKISGIAVFSAILLAGCGSSFPPITSAPIKNIDNVSAKTASLSETEEKAWAAADLLEDSIPGMSVERAYREILNTREAGTVIVGVIDSGVDIEHEDLKDVIWVNEDEVPGNGKDDDKNGYVDDIHGWNFLGDIVGESMEYTRYVRNLGPKFEGREMEDISKAEMEDYLTYKKAKAEYDKEYSQTRANKDRYEQLMQQMKPAHQAMTQLFGKEDYTADDLKGIKDPTPEQQQQIGMLSQMLNYGSPIADLLKQIEGGLDYFSGRLDTHFNVDKDFRAEKLGDDPDDMSVTVYGNADVDGPDPEKADARHGTHVSGIIAAKRNNGIGMDGVSDNAKIMVVRAVPDGDEYDKDIALAIRYAVDNGAKVINTSFGKYFSTHPDWVREAIRYAADKDVLIVNAAGNEGHDLDTIQVYPNDQMLNGNEFADNVLTVGAMGPQYGTNMVAPFSNYGKTSVDIFAPGVRIWSTTPLNTYEFLQGTSMAAPEVAGIAATIRAYYPKLSAAQVKQAIMASGLPSKMTVVLDGDKSNTRSFADASKSGKLANLYNALIMADMMSRN